MTISDKIRCGVILWYDKKCVTTDETCNGGIFAQCLPLLSPFSFCLNKKAGGSGVEYYFGYAYENSDLTCQDFSTRQKMWQQSKYALDFFRDNKVPFQDMVSSKNTNSLSSVKLDKGSTDWLLSLPAGDTNIIYRKVGNANVASITGLSAGKYILKWYNPRAGGALKDGSKIDIDVTKPTDVAFYGRPPATPDLDWVVLIRKA
jgi:hypothetical protein